MDITPAYSDLHTAVRFVKQYLQCMADLGIKGFDCTESTVETVKNWGKPRKNITPRGIVVKEITDSLMRIESDCRNCDLCPAMSRRKSLVPGSGNPNARLMFVGELPDHADSMAGKPFSGEAGQLLSKMIQAMGLTWDDVYITHAVKCKTPDNRRPVPDEINACMGFLDREISVVRPDVICTLGAFATQAILGKAEQVSNMRGHFHEYRSVKVLPTFHPAYLLKHPESKRESWEDLKKIMAALGLKRPGN